MAELALVVTPASRAWRRRLGAVAWAALEDLLLSARRDEAAWMGPVGVSGVAAGIAVTKDNAARAVAALGVAGILCRKRVDGPNGARSGYQLNLPDGIDLTRLSARYRPGWHRHRSLHRRQRLLRHKRSRTICAFGDAPSLGNA
jgi:hypothetical protein